MFCKFPLKWHINICRGMAPYPLYDCTVEFWPYGRILTVRSNFTVLLRGCSTFDVRGTSVTNIALFMWHSVKLPQINLKGAWHLCLVTMNGWILTVRSNFDVKLRSNFDQKFRACVSFPLISVTTLLTFCEGFKITTKKFCNVHVLIASIWPYGQFDHTVKFW